MAVYLLPDESLFPPVAEAEPDGLLAVGGDLAPERLLNAYASGIFPWFEYERDIYWYSPDPRMVLFPEKLKVASSLSRILKQKKFDIRYDTDFRGVMEACARVSRKDEPGTWISRRFIAGYTRLHRLGFAHSAEAYLGDKLAGGLYGIVIGCAFFGESMFYTEPDASKAAFVTLVRNLASKGFLFIDCQTETAHLKRFGAELIPRTEYLKLLSKAVSSRPSESL